MILSQFHPSSISQLILKSILMLSSHKIKMKYVHVEHHYISPHPRTSLTENVLLCEKMFGDHYYIFLTKGRGNWFQNINGIQTSSGDHPASYLMGTGDSLPWG
jgi:hypothetical protein